MKFFNQLITYLRDFWGIRYIGAISMHRIVVHSASVLFVQFPTIESSAVFPPPLDGGEILAKQYDQESISRFQSSGIFCTSATTPQAKPSPPPSWPPPPGRCAGPRPRPYKGAKKIPNTKSRTKNKCFPLASWPLPPPPARNPPGAKGENISYQLRSEIHARKSLSIKS